MAIPIAPGTQIRVAVSPKVENIKLSVVVPDGFTGKAKIKDDVLTADSGTFTLVAKYNPIGQPLHTDGAEVTFRVVGDGDDVQTIENVTIGEVVLNPEVADETPAP